MNETSVVTMALFDSARQEIMDGVYMSIQHIIESLSEPQVEWLTCLSTNAVLPKLPRNLIQELVERDIISPRKGAFEIQSSLLKDHLSLQGKL